MQIDPKMLLLFAIQTAKSIKDSNRPSDICVNFRYWDELYADRGLDVMLEEIEKIDRGFADYCVMSIAREIELPDPTGYSFDGLVSAIKNGVCLEHLVVKFPDPEGTMEYVGELLAQQADIDLEPEIDFKLALPITDEQFRVARRRAVRCITVGDEEHRYLISDTETVQGVKDLLEAIESLNKEEGARA